MYCTEANESVRNYIKGMNRSVDRSQYDVIAAIVANRVRLILLTTCVGAMVLLHYSVGLIVWSWRTGCKLHYGFCG